LARVVSAFSGAATRWAILSKLKSERATYFQVVQDEVSAEYEPQPEQFDEVTGRIGDELERLAAEDRHILILRHVAELSFQELADSLGIGLSAAKMRLYRAEQRLRVLYEEPPEVSEQ
jgi:RNA polymerase sigma factor (sigma-70 family)